MIRESLTGRWDLTVGDGPAAYPSWLEIDEKGKGRFVGRVGSARPLGHAAMEGEDLVFSLPPQYERRKDDLVFRGRLDGGDLRGTTTSEDGEPLPWIAHRAPGLLHDAEPKWGEPIELFNGEDLQGWHQKDAHLPLEWTVENGELVNPRVGSDLLTDAAFGDFRLVCEYRYPTGSNSGIYLRGRYEVQILDDFGKAPHVGGSGAIYGFLAPFENAALPADEWQTVEIELIGRRVTITLNRVTVIEREEIPGITGGALDSDEGAPGRIFLQGDHGPVTFRRVTLTPVIP